MGEKVEGRGRGESKAGQSVETVIILIRWLCSLWSRMYSQRSRVRFPQVVCRGCVDFSLPNLLSSSAELQSSIEFRG